MTHSLAWVVGSGGNLGSRLVRILGGSEVRVFGSRLPKFRWGAGATLERQLDEAVRAFAGEIPPDSRWIVLWSAGTGVVGSGPGELAEETSTFHRFLDLLGSHVVATADRPGVVFLASSAGGVYAGAGADQISESTSPAPISEYGRQKLRQETLLQEFVESARSVRGFVGRISNLYGETQNLAKPQGLLSHMSRCVIWNRPISIYVPLDTTRDYLYAGDCAADVVACLRTLCEESRTGSTPQTLVKIFASERGSTIAEVVSTFARIVKRQPRIVCSASPLGARQPRSLSFRSAILREATSGPKLSLLEGIQRLHGDQLRRYREGTLPAPPG